MPFIAKYRGRCSRTDSTILPGDVIDYYAGTRKIILVKSKSAPVDTIDLPNQYTGTYQRYYRNPRGLCEDAPCCGCCTI
jgi:hypothetical protein